MNTSKHESINLKIIDFNYNLILYDPHYPTSIFTLSDKIEDVKDIEIILSKLIGVKSVKRIFNFKDILEAMIQMKEYCKNPNGSLSYTDFKKNFYYSKNEIKKHQNRVKRILKSYS